MARFPDSFVNQVAQATDIVEVVGQYVALTKRGKEFVGVCPFHQDHRPSLNVSPTKQIFKCFACGAGGGVFQFLMRHQRMTFPEAVRHLAERAGIPVPQVAPPAGEGDRSPSREALAKVVLFAARFYRDRLHDSAGRAALEYVRKRQLSDDSIARFGLGCAPDAWEALRSAARREGFSDRQLLAAGLVAQRDNGSCYDRLRNRVVFPILDASGQVIAFGGRALDAGDRAKYLNSPETVLFDKSANLYALNWAREEIVSTQQAVVVEGYFDALMCLQAGIGNVVATLGTSLTERHVRTLARYAREAVLVFDADTAGEAAAGRAVELFLSQRLHVRVATVPRGAQDAGEVKDPCDYVLAAGADAMRALLDAAPDALEYAWSRRAADFRAADTLARKREIVEEFLTLVVSSAAYGAIDALRQGLLAGRLAELAGLSPADVAEQMRRLARRVRRGRGGPASGAEAEPGPAGGADAAERCVLGVLVNCPELFGSVRDRLSPEMFSGPLARTVAERVWRLADEGRLDLPALLGGDEGEPWCRLVTDVQVSAEEKGNYERVLSDAATVILNRRQREELEALKSAGGADPAEVLRRVSKLGRQPDARRHPRIP